MGHVGRLGTGIVNSSSSTGTITLTAGAAVGSTVIVGVGWDAPGGVGVPTITGVTDSRGNTYAVDVSAGAAGNTTVAITIGRGAVTTGLQVGDTITVTISSGARARWPLVAESFDDVLTSASPLDKTQRNDNPGNSGSLVTGTTAATTEANELVIALFGFGSGRTVTIDSGWSGGAKVETSAGSSDRAVQLVWKYVTATGTQQGTLGVSPSSTYAGAVATYKLKAEAHSGSATMTGSLGMAASGTPAVDGSGEVPGTLALTGSGTLAIGGGAGSLAGLLTLSARGTADTGIGTPPRPRTRWQLVLGPAAGGHELALTEASGRRYTARLNEGSDLSFSIDGRHRQAAAIGELTTDVHLLFSDSTGTQILDRCRVGQTRDDISEDEHRVEVTALDYVAVLARRILYSGDTLTFEGVDQAEIAWSLIDATQSRNAGALGIAKGWTGTSPTGITRDRTYEAGDSIGQRIQELSEVIDGFDWDITPVSASGLQLDVWHPRRGSDRGVVLILGGLVAAVQREVDPADYANALRYTGATGDDETPGPTPVEREAALLGQAVDWPQGRWDLALGDDGLTTQAALDARAEWQLAESQVIRPVYTVRLKRGGWGGPDHIWLGDTVRLIVPSGRLEVDTTARVHEVAIDIDEDGGETVTLTLGGPRPDFRRWPSRVDRRLRDLERR